MLAFLVAGPVMTVPSVVAVMALVHRQALYVYMSVGLLGPFSWDMVISLQSLYFKGIFQLTRQSKVLTSSRNY